MLKPYVYISTGKSKDVQRDAPYGARVAIHYPELSRTIELEADAQGRWYLQEIPSPGHGGSALKLAQGGIIHFVEEA